MAAGSKLYGFQWSAEQTPLDIEMHCIRKDGARDGKWGVKEQIPLHYENMRRILWPRLDGDHNGQRWHTLCKNEILKNRVTVLMGPGSSNKTHSAAWVYLCEYFCFSDETCVLVSSTDMRGLRLRVWGEIAMLWKEATEKFDHLAGHLLDSRVAITTDNLEDGEFGTRTVRDMRKGIIGIPTTQGSTYVGLSKWCGVKQKRVRLIADESQMMGASFLSAFANLNKNEDFRAIIIGNPVDPLDPLGKAAEPLDGWSGHLEPKKTEVWKTRFMNGTCVNLIGTDSPNFDFPADKPTRFKYLISREKIADTLSFFPKDSIEYYSQCVGSMKIGTLDYRVITRDLCRQYNALDDVIWDGSEKTVKVAALDAAYGGDRCVCGHIEFGKDVKGGIILSISPPQIVPILVSSSNTPEDQIAEWVRDYCTQHEIPPENFFHDSTGRGSLGTALARAWSAQCNPVEFGGKATDRPVSLDLYMFDNDTQQRRLVMCSEHYDRFVSELWYQVRYAIESRQVRNMPEDVMDEMCMRMWRKKNNKISIETKEEMKKRTSRSPDLGDFLAIACEGARRLGFQISKIPNRPGEKDSEDYLKRELQLHQRFVKRHELSYT